MSDIRNNISVFFLNSSYVERYALFSTFLNLRFITPFVVSWDFGDGKLFCKKIK